MIQGLADGSHAVAGLAAAIRIGPNRHVTEPHWSSDTTVTAGQSLPARDGGRLILPSGPMVMTAQPH